MTLKQIASDRGMLQTAVKDRIFDWFVRQPELFQFYILGQLKGNDEVDIIAILHERHQAERAADEQVQADVETATGKRPRGKASQGSRLANRQRAS